jgi:hypothetical protein
MTRPNIAVREDRRDQPMASPVPGMDPYLEDERLWPAFHSHLIQSFNQLLAPGLMNRYVSRIAERRYAEEREPYIEVHSTADDRLVTVLDLISPANKADGPGRQAYLEQRQQSRAAGASLVEIDLVLQGRPLQDYAREGLPDWDYAVTVTRSVQPDRYEIYTGMLDKRLPRFRLPLCSICRPQSRRPTMKHASANKSTTCVTCR